MARWGRGFCLSLKLCIAAPACGPTFEGEVISLSRKTLDTMDKSQPFVTYEKPLKVSTSSSDTPSSQKELVTGDMSVASRLFSNF